MAHQRREVRRGARFVAEATARYPPGGSADGRPSFELLEETVLRAVEEQCARDVDSLLPESPGSPILIAATAPTPNFPPLVFYVVVVGDVVELVGIIDDPDYWDLIGGDPTSVD